MCAIWALVTKQPGNSRYSDLAFLDLRYVFMWGWKDKKCLFQSSKSHRTKKIIFIFSDLGICKTPFMILHTSDIQPDTDSTPDTLFQITCLPGYSASEATGTMQCHQDGRWLNIPTCNGLFYFLQGCISISDWKCCGQSPIPLQCNLTYPISSYTKAWLHPGLEIMSPIPLL